MQSVIATALTEITNQAGRSGSLAPHLALAGAGMEDGPAPAKKQAIPLMSTAAEFIDPTLGDDITARAQVGADYFLRRQVGWSRTTDPLSGWMGQGGGHNFLY